MPIRSYSIKHLSSVPNIIIYKDCLYILLVMFCGFWNLVKLFGSHEDEKFLTPFAHSCTKVLVDTSADLKQLLKWELDVHALSNYDGENDTKEYLNSAIDISLWRGICWCKASTLLHNAHVILQPSSMSVISEDRTKWVDTGLEA